MDWRGDPILSVEHLSMRFGGLLAVDDLSFEVGRGDITALIGPNGAGKTTVFNCITGFYKPSRGRLALRLNAASSAALPDEIARSGRRFSGSDGCLLLERMTDHEIARRARVARTFQNIRLFPGMTALENLVVAQHNALMAASGFGLLAMLGAPAYRAKEAEAAKLAVSWLDRVGLTHRADDPAGALPYGDQRRLEIARAMCTEPALLCLDEPAAGLNPRESAALNQLLRTIRSECGTSIFLIEHDMSVVMGISDHVIVLDYGKKIADDESEAVRRDPQVIAAYLGVADEDEVQRAEAEIETIAGGLGERG